MKPFPSSESFKGSHCLMELSSNSVLLHPFVILLMLFPLPGMPLLTVCLITPPHLLGLGSGISSSWHLSWHLALRQNWPQPPLYQWFPSPPYYNNITYHIGNFLFPYLTPSLDVKLLVYESCIKGWILTSLVVQCLRVCLPMQRMQFWSLVWENSTCCLATKAVGHHYRSLRPRACIPQEKPLQWEAHPLQLE